MQLQLENEDKNGVPEDMETLSWFQDILWEQPEGSDKSQLNQGASLLDCWESRDPMNCSMETECMDKDVQSKFVETTSHDLVCEGPLQEGQSRVSGEVKVKEDKKSVVGLKADSNICCPLQNNSGVENSPSAAEHSIQGSDMNPSAGSKAKKTKVII